MCLRLSYLIIFEVLLFIKLCSTRVLMPSGQARLSLAEPMPSYYIRNIDGHPGTYSFGYDILDPVTGNKQFRTEERYPNGTVVGSYGYLDALGRPYRFNYVADERGYRVKQDLPFSLSRPTTQPSTFIETPTSATTEETITWTRPSKKKNKNKITTSEQDRKNSINSLNYANNYVKDFYFES